MRQIPPMQMLDWTTERAAPSFDEAPTFKLLVAYDDFAHGMCAMNLIKWLIEDFGREFTFVPRFVRFEELLQADIAKEIASEAAEADMIVIAAYEEGERPALVKEWLQARKGRANDEDGAFVAMLSTSQGAGSWREPVEACLREVATRASKSSCCKRIDWPTRETEFPVEIRRRENERAKGASGVIPGERKRTWLRAGDKMNGSAGGHFQVPEMPPLGLGPTLAEL